MKEEDKNNGKAYNTLVIWELLSRGNVIGKEEIANKLNISKHSVQRCIKVINYYLEKNSSYTIIYKRSENGYISELSEDGNLFKMQILIICKILLESRGLKRTELDVLILKLLSLIPESDAKNIERILNSERHYYSEPKHAKELIDTIWKLTEFIQKKEIIKFMYIRQDLNSKRRTVKPVSILFSEQYFYLIGFMADNRKTGPTIFRIDRISNIKGTKQIFKDPPYKERFSEGEFNKRVQFMYSGELQKVKLEFYGTTPEPILDRIPSATVIKKEKGVYLVTAEVYGDGIIMWLLSQGNKVKFIKPDSLKEKIKKQLELTLELYS